MNFSTRILIGYDHKWFNPETLAAVISYGNRMETTATEPEMFAMAGLRDYGEALEIVREWYDRQMPVLRFLELKGPGDANATDPLWAEPISGTIEFNRGIDLPASIKQDPLKLKWTKEGPVRTQNGEIYLCPWHLSHKNYLPGIGDFVIYGAVTYEVTSVQAQPTDYWLQTKVPLHVQVMIKPASLPVDAGCLECLTEEELSGPISLNCDASLATPNNQVVSDPHPAAPPANESPTPIPQPAISMVLD